MAEEVDDFLEHYGVRGMKWGKRKAVVADLNAKGPEGRAKAIDKARSELYSGKTKADWKAAKSKYKTEKATKGKYAARVALEKARDKQHATILTSAQSKNGKEVFERLMLGTDAMGTPVVQAFKTSLAERKKAAAAN